MAEWVLFCSCVFGPGCDRPGLCSKCCWTNFVWYECTYVGSIFESTGWNLLHWYSHTQRQNDGWYYNKQSCPFKTHNTSIPSCKQHIDLTRLKAECHLKKNKPRSPEYIQMNLTKHSYLRTKNGMVYLRTP